MRIELLVSLDRPNYGLTVNPETVVLSRMVCSDKRMDEYRMTKCRPVITPQARNSAAIMWQKTRTKHVVRISSVIVSDIKEQP